MPHQDGALDPHFVEEAAQILRHIRGRVARRRHVAVPVPAQIVSSDAVLAPQNGRHVEVPDCQIAEEAVQHHHIGTHAHGDVMQVHSISFYLWHTVRVLNVTVRQWYITM